MFDESMRQRAMAKRYRQSDTPQSRQRLLQRRSTETRGQMQ
jgi:hypothetical protein